ncbi:MAG: hypothetical protein FJX52_00300 [Alphaproteobacteria bacterium]|nr:hypothetical protein [Alphaproteobacteria bacterium]
MGNLNFSNWRGPRIYLNPGEALAPEQQAALKKELTYDFVNDRSPLFGSPDDIVRKLRELRDVTNIEHVILKANWVDFDHEHTMRSLRLFGEHVIPRLREDERKMRGNGAAAREPAAPSA